MNGRREFLRQVLPTAAVGVATLNTDWLSRTLSATAAVADRPATEVAADEGVWRDIQQAFTLDRTIINLNNGYTCPSPRVVHEALKRYLDISNQAPIHFMWNQLEPNVEQVRRKLAWRSAATPRSWPSHATRAKRCRFANSASISNPAIMWSPRTRTTVACSTPGISGRGATRSK